MSCRLSFGKTTGCRLTAGLVQEISRYKRVRWPTCGEAALAEYSTGRPAIFSSVLNLNVLQAGSDADPGGGRLANCPTKTPRPQRKYAARQRTADEKRKQELERKQEAEMVTWPLQSRPPEQRHRLHLRRSMLAGRQQEIHAERDRKLEAARKQRQIRQPDKPPLTRKCPGCCCFLQLLIPVRLTC